MAMPLLRGAFGFVEHFKRVNFVAAFENLCANILIGLVQELRTTCA